ncbi:MAG: phosphopyruvate hydratase [Alphaproteobacteria bacterium]|nr:phosphopyruvate hydratase [Alphaproteobacteria bacterium]
MPNTAIESVTGLCVWDSRGRPTVEACVRLACGAEGRAIAPAGASTGSGEAVDLRDGGHALGGLGVARAVANVAEGIAPALAGMDADDQEAIDAAMIELDGTANKGRLGGNAMIAVSMAVAHAAAAAHDQPLWRYLRAREGVDGAVVLPMPEIQIFGGGAHAGRRVDVQDFMAMPIGAESFAEACVMTAEVYRAAGAIMGKRGKLMGVADEGGFWPAFDTNEEAIEALLEAIEKAGFVPGEEVAISLDIAASELHRDGLYSLGLEKRALDSDAMAAMVLDWVNRYPIVSVEDPLGEHDPDGLARFTAAALGRVQVVGDDAVVTSAARIAALAARGACNTALIKPNQAGTLSETLAAVKAARAEGWGAIVSARSGETEDVTIVHLALGWGVEQLKVGSFARSERIAKWNEAIRIEDALGQGARFATGLPFPLSQ